MVLQRLVRLAFIMIDALEFEELGVLVALTATLTPLMFLLVALTLIIVAVVLSAIIIDPDGEYMVVGS